MKTTFSLFAFVSVLLLCSSCKNTKYTANNLPDRQLRWGRFLSGPGVYDYILLDNGQIFVQDRSNQSIGKLGKIKSKKANTLFAMIEPLRLESLNFYHPGNGGEFIEVRNNGKKNCIVWGAKDNPIDPKVKDFYNQLKGLPKNWMWENKR